MSSVPPSVGCRSGKALTRADIPDWFRVDDQGRIWTTRKPGGWPGTQERRAERRSIRGYLTVGWPDYRQAPAHRVVYAWHCDGVPAGVLVRHLNGDRTDNRPENLALGSALDNAEDAKVHGTLTGDQSRGERHYRTHLTDDDVRSIRASRAGGDSLATLAARYGISKSNVAFIVNRQTWRHVA